MNPAVEGEGLASRAAGERQVCRRSGRNGGDAVAPDEMKWRPRLPTMDYCSLDRKSVV